jgi:hypothetical protein
VAVWGLCCQVHTRLTWQLVSTCDDARRGSGFMTNQKPLLWCGAWHPDVSEREDEFPTAR